MQKRLQRHFGTAIIITEVKEKANFVTFRRTASSILHDFYKRSCTQDTENEKASMIQTAVRFIKADIMSLHTSKSEYPSSVNISSPEKNTSLFLPQ